ncbi:MAG: PEP-CTERM system histidine kinase PrsK [Nitrospira sp.]|nr:PEP-CTERM system histidine kinase PrsK [Nitrospira sp.]
MNFSDIISIFSILTSIIVALFMFAKNRSGIANIAFALGMCSIAAIEFGDFMTLGEPSTMLLYKRISLVGESLLPGLWLLFSLTFARKDYKELSVFWKAALFTSILPPVCVSFIPLRLFFYSPDIETEKILFLGGAGYYFYLFMILYAILTLVNLEGTLRASSGAARWRIKHMLIGAGGIMALLLFYYSHALLYRSLDMNLSPLRASGVILSSVLITVSLFRQTFPKEEIALSRGMLYKSLTLLVVGIYLLGLGIVGAGMRYFGEDFSKYLSLVIVFAGTLALTATLFSETVRRKMKVFIDKNFFRDKYDYRAQWLQFTERISSTKSFDELLTAILGGFASAMGSQRRSLWLYDSARDIYYQSEPSDASGRHITIKGGNSLISYFKEKGWVFNVKEGDHKILEENREAFRETGASLVVPLISNGSVIGFITLGKSLGGETYTYEDYDLLKTLARQATSALMSARLAEELAEAREMEAMGRISSFVLHDLKNLVYTLSLTAENAQENITNHEFQKDMIQTLSSTVEKAKSLIQKLSEMPQKEALNLQTMDLVPLIKETIKPFLNGKTKVEVECPGQLVRSVDGEEMRKVIQNLVLNAIEATKGGEVHVRAGTEDGMAYIRVSDNGCGMSEEYIEKNLFKPFYSTKKKGLGIGLYQCKSIVEAHGGRIKVKSKQDVGTDFSVYLPLD